MDVENETIREQIRPGFQMTDLIRRILLSWLIAVTVEYLLLPQDLQNLAGVLGLAQMSLGRVLGITALLTAVLTLAGGKWNTAAVERWTMAAAFAVLGIAAYMASPMPAFGITCGLILVILTVYGFLGWQEKGPRRARVRRGCAVFPWITGILAAAFFLLISAWTVGRIWCFGTPTYDFGLFAQMFHNMKETGLPMTTLERDGWLSHFAVHVSPIYYLILPVYWLIPRPETLQVAQAAILASAVIPLWKLGRRHGLTQPQRMLVCALLLLHPAYSGGTSYDIHENCFLTPLLLWLLYGLDRENRPITIIAALLTLMVKEDAAVYVAVIGLFWLVKSLVRKDDESQIGTGLVLMGVSVVWFFLVTGYLATQGDGVMTYRYNNFIYDGSGSLLTVIKAALMNPLKVVYECVDPEKLKYIGQTMGPLLLLPLVTRRYERYILLIPYVLVNLMSDYPYQHDIFFQYNFGSLACLIYLTVVNLADVKIPWKRLAPLGCALLVAFCCFSKAIWPDAIRYPKMVMEHADHYQAVRETLDQIPENASVAAWRFYTTYLSQRETVYDVDYSSKKHMLECEYVVLDTGPYTKYRKYGALENVCDILEKNGYEVYAEKKGTLVIYKAPDA